MPANGAIFALTCRETHLLVALELCHVLRLTPQTTKLGKLASTQFRNRIFSGKNCEQRARIHFTLF
jgi:hypothetical protein